MVKKIRLVVTRGGGQGKGKFEECSQRKQLAARR